MKKLLLAATGLIALATPALAADMAPAPVYTKAPPPVVVPCTWCGGYIGINGGGGWQDNSWTYPDVNFYSRVAGQGFRTNPDGGLAGGQIGYNWQLSGPWIMGAELMGDWANLKQTVVGPIPTFPNDTYTTRLRDLESLTLRFGYGPTNWLFYGKAGVATGTERLDVLSGPPVAGVAYSISNREWGPTAGVGVEYMMTPNIVFGLEYDYASLSKISTDPRATCTVTLCNTQPLNLTQGQSFLINGGVNSSRYDVNTVTARLSYKWGGPIVSRY